MFRWLSKIIQKWLDWYDIQKGVRYFKLKKIEEASDDGYVIKTDQGFTINIYCKEYAYMCIYMNKWARNKELPVYHVYCVCSDDTPEDIKNRFSTDLKISTFLHPWSSKESQKMQAIRAYVDLVSKDEI